MKRRVLIVDDESPARSKLVHFLGKCDKEADVDEASDGPGAIAAIESTPYHAVFLDIQMPGMSGFEVVYNVGIEQMPPYVFATAYDAYAIQAFEARAIDYLLKPFTFDRFHQSYLRLIKLVSTPKPCPASDYSLLWQLCSNGKHPMRIAVRTEGKIRLIEPDKIIYIESDEHYLRYHIKAEQTIYERGSLKDLLSRLDPMVFQQVHRRSVINLRYLKEIEPISHGDYTAVLTTGQRITISRRYKNNLGLK